MHIKHTLINRRHGGLLKKRWRPTLTKTEQAFNGLYSVSDYNRPIMFNHWHIWSVTRRRILSQLPSSTAVKSLDMKQTEKHFSNTHIYKASSQAEFNIRMKTERTCTKI